MKLQTETVVGLVAIAVAAVAGIYLARKAAAGAQGLVDAAGAVGAAINPLSDQNVFYRGASAVADAIAGDGKQSSLGSRAYELFHRDELKAQLEDLSVFDGHQYDPLGNRIY